MEVETDRGGPASGPDDGQRTGGATVSVLYADPTDPPSALSTADDLAVSTVPTAAAARERLSDAETVDCVVSEYDLPDRDGLALLEAVRATRPDLPFVVFTDSGSEAVASEAVRLGVTDYLPREAGGERLRERVARAVTTDSAATDGAATDPGVEGDWPRELTSDFPDAAFLVDRAGRYLELLSVSDPGRHESVDRNRFVGERLHDAFAPETADRLLDQVRTTLDAGTVETVEYRFEEEEESEESEESEEKQEQEDGRKWYEARTVPLGEAVDGRDAVVWVARDVTERHRNERELATSRDELARITRINGLIYGIVQSLVGSASREEIERTVCERLAESEFYQFAWIGGPWVQDERTNPSVVEGVDRSAVERLVEATSARADEGNAFARVVTDSDSVVVRNVVDDDWLSEREREIMLDLGMSSAALVPLSHGTPNYGVLGISGAHAGTFSDRELTALETLGGIVSFAIDAVRNRNLLLSDTAVELEFRVDSRRSRYARLSAELDARLWLEGVVPISDDRLLEYVAVDGASAEAVADRLDSLDETENHRVVTDDDDVGMLELELGRSGVTELLKAGTVVTTAEAEDGVVEYVAEASADANVRSIIDAFRSTFPDSELVGKQEVDRPVHTATEFGRTLDSDLTDKQRTALQTAYFAGYYEYPRASTGEEVAESLEVSSPTLHQHLQAAQRKLVETYLDR